MTQMTQSFKTSRALAPCFLGHLGHVKNNDPNDPMACMAMQFKTVTQMTQMTQRPPACMAMLAPAGNMWPVAGGRWHAPAWPLAIPTMLEGGWVGPSGKGQQKRTGCEQFFFLQNFANCSKFLFFYFLL
jgi:hypothetical protein